MPEEQSHIMRNALLRSLSTGDLRRVEQHLEPVALGLRDVLVEANIAIRHVYFMESGVASVVTWTPAGRGIEVWNVGREGMTGVSLVLDVDRTPLETFVQVPGSAFRLDAEMLRQATADSPSLRTKLLRYAHTVMVQAAETAHALGHYTVYQRLARWILMSHDRADGDDLPLTHDLLAIMLGVRRSGVTDALHRLEGEGMIKANRGHVVVRDRDRLIILAGGSYGRSEAEYERVMSLI